VFESGFTKFKDGLDFYFLLNENEFLKKVYSTLSNILKIFEKL